MSPQPADVSWAMDLSARGAVSSGAHCDAVVAVPSHPGAPSSPPRASARPDTGGFDGEDPSRTRQSPLTLATFRSWGIHWMTPHEGPGMSVPDVGASPPAAGRTKVRESA